MRKLNAPFLRYVKSLIKVAYPMGETVEEEDYLRRLKRYAGLGVDLDNFPSSKVCGHAVQHHARRQHRGLG